MLTEYNNYEYDISEYHKILNGGKSLPEFLIPYINLPLIQRLKGIGLLCGTDWTPLYKNRFYYSRLDHSIGVALIIYHFTKSKAQTISGLLHDVSTPVFSHVSDFRKGDALTQTQTESENALIIKTDKKLLQLLKKDHIEVEEVSDYHIYPVADNEIPQLSSDRLEYMFPSGMALHGSWTLDEIKNIYSDIRVLKNEQGFDELGFVSLPCAETYCYKFCMTGHILQLNENKLALNLLGKIMNLAIQENVLAEKDFMSLSEEQIINNLSEYAKNKSDELSRLFRTFRTMTEIKHTQKELSGCYCVNLNVKQRYIDPLVLAGNKTLRLSVLSEKGKKIIEDFKSYTDTPFGCVKISE